MSIERAIEGSSPDAPSREARARLHGRIVDVHVDTNNVLRSYITVEADSKNNMGLFDGTYNVSLNEELTAAQRFQAATVAREKGSGVCGGLINEAMIRRKGKPVLLNNFRLTGDHVGTCRWIDFSRREVHRRAALVHTSEVKAPNQKDGAGFPRITHITVMRHEAFDIEDAESVERMKRLADEHFKEATRPRDYRVLKDPSKPDGDQLIHLRSSMPRSAFAFVIIDPNNNSVLEYSGFLHQRRQFKDSEMPSHFTDEDIKEFKGQYPSLPYNSESVQKALTLVKAHANKVHGPNAKVLCVEGVRYRISKKAQSTNIQSPRRTDQGPQSLSEMSPVEMIHLANQAQYVVAKHDDDKSWKIQNCTYVPDVTFNFADNSGDTFSRFIDCKTEYPAIDTPWITKITYNQQPLVVPDFMQKPAINAIIGGRFDHNPQASTQTQDVKRQASPEEPRSATTAVIQQDGAGAERHRQPEAQTRTSDPIFAQSEALESTPKHNDNERHLEDAEEMTVSDIADPDADLYHGPSNYTFGH